MSHQITLKGNPIHTSGELPALGSKAPAFELVGQDLGPVTSADFAGKRVVLNIPKGTQSGTKFRIRGQGVTKGDRKGDQYVEVVVSVPEELSEEERKVMEEFAEASGLKH